jgi:hypothetical protein
MSSTIPTPSAAPALPETAHAEGRRPTSFIREKDRGPVHALPDGASTRPLISST